MPKRFKFKLPRLISSSFQICRSRSPSTFPDAPLPNKPGRRMSSPKAVHTPGFPQAPPSTPDEDSFVSVKLIRSVGRPRRDHEGDSSLDVDSIEYSWRDDGRWHVVNKGADSEDELEPVMVGRYENSKRGDGAAVRKRDASSVSMRVFSSGKYGSNETESMLLSSARFWKEEDERLGVASVSLLKRTTSMDSDGAEVRDSVAVVKRSENPLEDFRTSMIEMVVERRMFEAPDLERLLRCFLSLNSREYHGIIVEAFSELWQMMFSDEDSADFTK
ncbi:hypothetical protein MLD38_022268 [Melastoma candidum]|uniref:Uncharacterized protein n=1 Tax=Melastoma candidum TaxID=119954 RepID=A0ACB9QJX5_9MYRT|nr:hypothetical protein MLD38_022268 [Melastoma candidum]